MINAISSYEQIATQWGIDGLCTQDNIVQKAIEAPMLHGKYWGFLVTQKKKKAKLEYGIQKTTALLLDFYTKRLSNAEITANGLDVYNQQAAMLLKLSQKEAESRIPGHPMMKALVLERAETLQCIEFLESIIDILKKISYTAKVFVDWEKFKAGQ